MKLLIAMLMKNQDLFIKILVLQIITGSTETCSKVTCSIDDPAIFGRNVSILCENNSSTRCEDRTWMGGHNFKSLNHLLHNGIPHVSLGNSTKYTEKVISCQDIQLVISNFSEEDLNQQFVFTVGFHQCRFNVSFGSTNFEYHPNDGEIKTKINLSSTALSLSVKMEKVYPVPNCSIIFGDEHLENLAKMHINRTGNLYTVHTFVEYSSKEGECPITANVICQIGETGIMMISSNFTNCTSIYILRVFPWDVFAIQLSCILVMIFCILMVIWSLRRNWTNIIKTCKDLSKRKPEQWRRPVLAILSASVSVTLSVQTEVMSIKQVLQLDMSEKQNIVTPVSLCLSSVILTPVSLCFLSNPETISIRKGFRKAVDNFMKRMEKWKSCRIRCIPKHEHNIAGTRPPECPTEGNDRCITDGSACQSIGENNSLLLPMFKVCDESY